jgi:hypothetical protein
VAHEYSWSQDTPGDPGADERDPLLVLCGAATVLALGGRIGGR